MIWPRHWSVILAYLGMPTVQVRPLTVGYLLPAEVGLVNRLLAHVAVAMPTVSLVRSSEYVAGYPLSGPFFRYVSLATLPTTVPGTTIAEARSIQRNTFSSPVYQDCSRPSFARHALFLVSISSVHF